MACIPPWLADSHFSYIQEMQFLLSIGFEVQSLESFVLFCVFVTALLLPVHSFPVLTAVYYFVCRCCIHLCLVLLEMEYCSQVYCLFHHQSLPVSIKTQFAEQICFCLNFSAASELHHEFPMIKYARGGRSIPHERVFKLDNDNLVGHQAVNIVKVTLCHMWPIFLKFEVRVQIYMTVLNVVVARFRILLGKSLVFWR